MAKMPDDVIEALVNVAAKRVAGRPVDHIPSDEELEQMDICKLSPKLEKRINKIIRRHNNTQKMIQFTVKYGRAAAVIGIFLILSVTVLMSVEASRVFVLNQFLGQREDHTLIQFLEPGAGAGSIDIDGYVLGYAPDGFEFAFYHVLHDRTLLIYLHPDGLKILLYQYSAEIATLGVDNVYTTMSTIFVNQQEATLFTVEGDDRVYTLIWMSGNTALQLDSNIELDELIRVAENIVRN